MDGYEKWLQQSENDMYHYLTTINDDETESDVVDEIICKMRLREGLMSLCDILMW